MHAPQKTRDKRDRRLTANQTHDRPAKKVPAMKSQFILILITVSVLMISGCNTGTNPVTSIILDFPHGGLRLLVQRDGDIRLYYGALPTSQAVKNGIFDIDELFQQLQLRLHEVVPAEARPLGQPYGMATLEFSDGSERDYLIYDQAFAKELFKAACANSLEVEDSARKLFTAQCNDLNTTP